MLCFHRREGRDTFTLRVKIAITVICLLAALIAAGFAVMNTVQAFHSLQQQHALAKSGDVRTIRPWMTIPYIAHTYHVPEKYLYQTLHLDPNSPPRHATLHALASHYQKPVDSLIYDVQHAIVTYRRAHTTRDHPHGPTVTPTSLPRGRNSTPVGRMVY